MAAVLPKHPMIDQRLLQRRVLCIFASLVPDQPNVGPGAAQPESSRPNRPSASLTRGNSVYVFLFYPADSAMTVQRCQCGLITHTSTLSERIVGDIQGEALPFPVLLPKMRPREVTTPVSRTYCGQILLTSFVAFK
jgi:hypothetical protein